MLTPSCVLLGRRPRKDVRAEELPIVISHHHIVSLGNLPCRRSQAELATLANHRFADRQVERAEQALRARHHWGLSCPALMRDRGMYLSLSFPAPRRWSEGAMGD